MEDSKKAMSLVRNLVRVGEVNSVNSIKRTVKVLFIDRDNIVSGYLPLLASAPIPIVGQRVACIFLGNGIEDGFCLGGFGS